MMVTTLGAGSMWAGLIDDAAAPAIRLGLAASLGWLIGLERGRADKPADSRTMLLVALGAAAFTLLGERVIADMAAQEASLGASSIVRADPNRVLSYVVSGVGFLGAGTILHSKRVVRGLTTASSVWCTAAVGAACGMGEYSIALVAFLLIAATLWIGWVVTPPPEERSGAMNGAGFLWAQGDGPTKPGNGSGKPTNGGGKPGNGGGKPGNGGGKPGHGKKGKGGDKGDD